MVDDSGKADVELRNERIKEAWWVTAEHVSSILKPSGTLSSRFALDFDGMLKHLQQTLEIWAKQE